MDAAHRIGRRRPRLGPGRDRRRTSAERRGLARSIVLALFATCWALACRQAPQETRLQESPGWSLYEQGRSAEEAGRVDEARSLFARAIEADAGRAVFHGALGLLEWRAGELERASERFERAAELAPRIVTHQVRAARVALARRDPERARELARSALALLEERRASGSVDPESEAWALGVLAAARLGLGEEEGVGDLVAAAVRVESEDAALWELLGACADDLGRAELAEEALSRAVELEPRRPELHGRLAELLEEAGRSAEAEKARRDEAFWTGFATEGASEEPSQADRARMAEDVASALALVEGSGVAFGYDAFDRDKLERALEILERVLARNAENADAQYVAGYAWSLLHEYPRAIARLERAVELNPGLAEAWRGLGALHLALGEAERALADLQRALEISPLDGALQYDLGVCLEELGLVDQAYRAYRRSLLRLPSRVQTHFRLGTLLVRGGFERMGRRRLEEYAWWKEREPAVQQHDPAGSLESWHDHVAKELAEGGGGEWGELALLRLLAASERFGDAQPRMVRLLERDRRNPELLVDCALLCEGPGDASQRNTLLRRALKIDKVYRGARLELALMLDDRGRADEADEQYAILFGPDPDGVWTRAARPASPGGSTGREEEVR